MARCKNRVGEENVNNSGSKMIISRYEGIKDIDIYFPEYNWTAKNRLYKDFQQGTVRCPYDTNVYNVGYLGEGKYNCSIKRKLTNEYKTWSYMLERCYNTDYLERFPSYIDCTVCTEWHNFQNFAKWYEENYYEVENSKMCLDKDILCKGNRIYSPKNCIFVPEEINLIFLHNNKKESGLPKGVTRHKDKFRSRSHIIENGKTIRKHLGLFDTPEEAFYMYKSTKEKYIKQVADIYQPYIPNELYQAMYSYEIDINDK